MKKRNYNRLLSLYSKTMEKLLRDGRNEDRKRLDKFFMETSTKFSRLDDDNFNEKVYTVLKKKIEEMNIFTKQK